METGCKRADMVTYGYGALEVGRPAASVYVEVKRSGAREACCGRGDVEVFASRDQELGRHAAGLRTLPQKRSGGALQACRCGGICLKRSGAREAVYRCVDVEV